MKTGLSKAERTRNFIIERTAEVFNKKGYAGTSVSDLVDATGLTRGSIYGNFQNKEEVALAAFDYNHDRIANKTQDLIVRKETCHGKLMVYADVYRKMLKGSVSRGGCAILNTAVEADDTNLVLKRRAAKAIENWEDNVIKLIEQGIESGEFRRGVHAKKMALSIIALIEGGVMISKVRENRESFELILDTVESLIRSMETEA